MCGDYELLSYKDIHLKLRLMLRCLKMFVFFCLYLNFNYDLTKRQRINHTPTQQCSCMSKQLAM